MVGYPQSPQKRAGSAGRSTSHTLPQVMQAQSPEASKNSQAASPHLPQTGGAGGVSAGGVSAGGEGGATGAGAAGVGATTAVVARVPRV
jgi:hypothetical protein